MNNVSIIKPDGPALYPEQETALTPFHGGATSIARMKERMSYQKEMRALLVEYVRSEMDPERHFYTIPGSPKPALSQDGARMLCTLYGVSAEETIFEETIDPDGHYAVRATVRLRGSFMAEGSGRCSTRESKYAYKWMWPNEIPASVQKATLDRREKGNNKFQYKVPNHDLADQYNTVLQMAEKRAMTRATLRLPCAPDVFCDPGQAEEEREADDASDRKELMGLLVKWTRTLPAGTKNRAFKAVTGVAYDQITTLPLLALDNGLALAEQASAAGIDWKSKTLDADLTALQGASAATAKEELFGDGGGSDPTAHRPPVSQPVVVEIQPSTPHESTREQGGSTTNLEPPRGLPGDTRHSLAWDILTENQDNAVLPPDLLERIQAIFSPLAPGTEAEAFTLADEVQSYLDGQRELGN